MPGRYVDMIYIYCDRCGKDITEEFGFSEEFQITIFDLKNTKIHCSDCIRQNMIEVIKKNQYNKSLNPTCEDRCDLG